MNKAEARLFQAAPADGYEWILPRQETDFDAFMWIEGPLGASWVSPPVKLLHTDDKGYPLERASMPWLTSGVLVLRDEAVDLIGSTLEPFGELRELDCSEARVFLFNPMILSDALDIDRSDVVRFTTGRIMAVTRATFHDAATLAAGVFKVAELPRGPVFVTREIVAAIQAITPASGLSFEAV